MIKYRVPERIGIGSEPKSAFGIVPTFRNLRLFIDVQSLSLSADTPVCWYAEDERVTAWSNDDRVGDCITEHLDGDLGPTVSYPNGEVAIAHWESRMPWVRQTLPEALHDEARGKLPALSFARMMEADAFITQSPAILGLRDAGSDRHLPTIVTAEEALALLGLYLRFRQEYSYRTGARGTSSIGRQGYGVLAAQVLLPSVRLLGPQAQAVEVRLARALYARDRLHRCYFNPEDRGIGDEAFFYLDALLVSLVAAFDLVARHVHTTLKFENGERSASWSGSKWRDQLEIKQNAIFELTKKNVVTGATMTLCSKLRNYVHGMPLEGIRFQGTAEGPRTIALHIPSDDQTMIDNAMRLVGGDWKILHREADVMFVDVPTLAERLLATSVAALRELITALYPAGSVPAIPPAVGHLPSSLQTRVVEASRMLLGIEV